MGDPLIVMYTLFIVLNSGLAGAFIARGNIIWIAYAVAVLCWILCLALKLSTVISNARAEGRLEYLKRGIR